MSLVPEGTHHFLSVCTLYIVTEGNHTNVTELSPFITYNSLSAIENHIQRSRSFFCINVHALFRITIKNLHNLKYFTVILTITLI